MAMPSLFRCSKRTSTMLRFGIPAVQNDTGQLLPFIIKCQMFTEKTFGNVCLVLPNW